MRFVQRGELCDGAWKVWLWGCSSWRAWLHDVVERVTVHGGMQFQSWYIVKPSVSGTKWRCQAHHKVHCNIGTCVPPYPYPTAPLPQRMIGKEETDGHTHRPFHPQQGRDHQLQLGTHSAGGGLGDSPCTLHDRAMGLSVCVCVCVCVCACMCEYMCEYACLCVYRCVYMH